MFANKICILGAGTSGLTTALILKTSNPALDISIVKSAEIEIVGVGEGSTEHWTSFMNYVGITPVDIIKNTGATFKYGIKFNNWNGDNKDYFHSVVSNFNVEDFFGYLYVYHKLINDYPTLYETGVAEHVPNSLHYAPYEFSAAQFHFDTFKLNEYLQAQCLEKGINILTDTINDVILDDNGIKEIVGNEQTYNADLFIDCSGWRRALISKLGATYNSMQEYLPMNTAFTFATKHNPDLELPSYTSATALSSGWAFQIPTQDRFGNGYIYCDKFIDEESAVKEIEELYGQKITVGRRFKFDAGYLENVWIKNCVAIGLSASFIEPLEATSIGAGLQQAFALSGFIKCWSDSTPEISDTYNEFFRDVFQNIVDFVQLHYVTKREDSDFWKYCKTLKLTDFNKKTLPMFKKNLPVGPQFVKPWALFRHSNWLHVLHGLEIFDLEEIKRRWEYMPTEMRMDATVKLHIQKMNAANHTPVGHREALKNILERP